MRNLIEMNQKYFLVCDNQKCDYQLEQTEENEGHEIEFIGEPCPKCGENLLTAEDYLNYKKITKWVKWINKWFSWLTLFSGKVEEKDFKTIGVHVHNGFHFREGNVKDHDEKDMPHEAL